MKKLFDFKSAGSLSEACNRCVIRIACDDVIDSAVPGEDSDEKLAKKFGLKMPCDGLEYVVYIPVEKLKERRF